MKFKDKVFREIMKVYGIKNNQFIEINHKKLGNTAVNVELPLTGAIDLTLTKVGKIMDKIELKKGNWCDAWFELKQRIKSK